MGKIKFIIFFILFLLINNSIFADKINDLIANKKYQQALSLLKKNILPDDVDSRLRIAYIYSWMKKYDAAEKNFKLVLKLTPNYYDAVFGLSNVYFWQGKYEEAIRLLGKYRKSKVAEKVYYEIYKNQMALKKWKQANKTLKIAKSKKFVKFRNLQKINLFYVSLFYSESVNEKKISDFVLKEYWKYFNLSFSYKFSKEIIFLGYSDYYRYKNYDKLFSAGISGDVSNWLTSSFQYNLCDKAHFLEQYSLVNDNYFKLKKYHTSMQISETYKLYPNKSVIILTPGINVKIFNYLTSTFKFYYSIDSNNKNATSFQITESFDSVNFRLVVSYSKGNEVVDSSYNSLLDSETYLGKIKFKVTGQLFFTGNFSYYSDERNTERNEFGGGLEIKF
jgi:YaiO family outer membrane protein